MLLSEVKLSDFFDWIAELSSNLPKIDYKTYFIVVLAVIALTGLIVGLTFLGSYRFKLRTACRKIIKYLGKVPSIDDDNVSDFTTQCFSSKVPTALRDSWIQYLGVRFGYPSDIVSEENVYNKPVRRVREVRASVFIGIALILTAIFAFWGYGALEGNEMGVIFFASLGLSGIIYLILVIINRFQSKTCLEVFDEMQEDLDAKVNLQAEKNFATDSSPLLDLSNILDEIIARNTAKDVGFDVGGMSDSLVFATDGEETKPKNGEPKAEEVKLSLDDEYVESELITDESEALKVTEEKAPVADESGKAPDAEIKEPAKEETAEANDKENGDKVEEESKKEEKKDEGEKPADNAEVISDESATETKEDTAKEPVKEIPLEIIEEKKPKKGKAAKDNVAKVAETETVNNEKTEAAETEIEVPSKYKDFPIIVERILSLNPPRKVLLSLCNMLIRVYQKTENPEDKKIIVGCMNEAVMAIQSLNKK